MTLREFHLQCPFDRVLNALPHDKFDDTPHEKSQAVAKIVWTLAREAEASVQLIDTGELTFGAPPELPPAQMIESRASRRRYADRATPAASVYSGQEPHDDEGNGAGAAGSIAG